MHERRHLIPISKQPVEQTWQESQVSRAYAGANIWSLASRSRGGSPSLYSQGGPRCPRRASESAIHTGSSDVIGRCRRSVPVTGVRSSSGLCFVTSGLSGWKTSHGHFNDRVSRLPGTLRHHTPIRPGWRRIQNPIRPRGIWALCETARACVVTAVVLPTWGPIKMKPPAMKKSENTRNEQRNR
jgi:hypothetical protein